MVNLSSTEVFEFPVDRQQLYNHWANAALGTFPKSQLDPSIFTMDVGTHLSDATSSPQPGHVFWARETDSLLYVFHDEVDDTGVSLWLACGPDRFDVACLAAGPIPAGAVVQPLYDRWVGISTGASARIWNQRAIGTVPAGLNVSNFANTGVAFGGTHASGTWIPVSIDGIVWGYTTGIMTADRWVRVVDGSAGRLVRNTSGAVQPQHDDSVGMNIFTLTGSTTTPLRFQFIWSGPRVINLL